MLSYIGMLQYTDLYIITSYDYIRLKGVPPDHFSNERLSSFSDIAVLLTTNDRAWVNHHLSGQDELWAEQNTTALNGGHGSGSCMTLLGSAQQHQCLIDPT